MPKQPTYNVIDEKALFEAHPKFFKLDHGKIKKAIALEIELPGVEIDAAEEAPAAPAKRPSRKKAAERL